MKVSCPHCNAAYKIDDARVSPSGIKVRCPRCHQAFPVRPATAEGDAIPLPGGTQDGAGVRLPAPAASAGAGIPLPPPPGTGSIPLPPPDPAAAAEAASPFALGPAPEAHEPFPAAPAPVELPEPGDAQDGPLAFGEVDFSTPLSMSGPEPSGAGPAVVDDADIVVDGPEPEAAAPLPSVLAPPAGAPALDPFAEAPADPFGARSGPPSGAERAGASDELEMLFGEAGAGARGGDGYRVRRRSGKVFGPFSEGQVAEMLAKGELLGNEDVSSDGETFEALSAVPAFARVLEQLAAEEAAHAAQPAAARAPGAGQPFGDRMAAAKVVESAPEPMSRRWLKPILAGLAVAAVLGVGVGAGFTGHGFFFTGHLRRPDSKLVAGRLAGARAALARGDHASERSALDLAAQAVAAGGGSADAAALHAMAVAALERRHAAPRPALDQALRAADALERDDPGTLPALEARLAVALATAPGAATAAAETALAAALARAKPDPEAFALLGEAALARGDAVKAGAAFQRLGALEQGPRAPMGLARAALLRGKPAEARPLLEQRVAADAGYLPARLELAALAEAAGDVEGARAHLAPLLADAAQARLGPLERARARMIEAALLDRSAETAGQAEQALQAALQADPRFGAARAALVWQRLRRGDAAGAVAASDPVAAEAAADPALAAARVRALALAGRALDAAQLADQALRVTPGTPALLVAKAAALAAAGKPDEAAAVYRDALARDAAAVEPRVALGRLALARGDVAGAQEALAQAVEKGPRDPAAHAAVGDLRAAQGDAAGAEAAYRAALALDAEHAPAVLGLARLAQARGDLAGARAGLARALALEPRSAEAQLALGTLEWTAGDLARAEAALAVAVDLRPKDAAALSRLGAVKLQRGDAEAAVKLLGAAALEAPGSAEAQLWLGRALLARGETPAALVRLRKAVELAPGAAEPRLQLGQALERSGALQEAIDAYQAAAASGPALPEPHERMALLYTANGRCDLALAPLARALELAPRLTRLRVELGECQGKLGKHAEAVRTLRAAQRADPSAAQVLYPLARAVHEAEGARAAQPLYERAAREDPKNAMPHYFLGYAYKERGQRERAVQAFRAFLALKPDAPERRDIEAEIEDLGGGR